MFVVAITDQDWYDFQKQNRFIDRINFWSPGSMPFRALKPGERLVFKLKKTDDSAGGYGTFQEYKYQTIDESWNEFGRRNGFDSKEAFEQVITEGQAGLSNGGSGKCGCIVLSDVVYFDHPVKLSDYNVVFKKGTQRYKKYEQDFPFGQTVGNEDGFALVAPVKKKKAVQSVTLREGQAQFHTDVSIAYGHKCCISGETTTELLQAAHIQDYVNRESHHIQNGLLLRVDLHSLFDNGLLYIDRDYKVHVSPLVTSEDYRRYDGQKISLPEDRSRWPSTDALKLKENSYRK